MNTNDYHNSISANSTPKEAFDKISQVSKWWAAHVEGNSQKLNDVFTVSFGDTTVTFTITEVIAEKKIVWEVTDCYLSWLEDKKEWKGTKIVWKISTENDKTNVDMTHVGLTPEVACFNDCKVGWDQYIKKSLFKFLEENKGLPDAF